MNAMLSISVVMNWSILRSIRKAINLMSQGLRFKLIPTVIRSFREFFKLMRTCLGFWGISKSLILIFRSSLQFLSSHSIKFSRARKKLMPLCWYIQTESVNWPFGTVLSSRICKLSVWISVSKTKIIYKQKWLWNTKP